ncbi:UDP-N-acetylmuramate dehydrogenase [Actinoplanes sp. NBRC 103695]|uniref:UDP-N-acetylmuramate dehydrogenase n=1 Tax=Actinoplanes sp. NBRC 103695 TaxID=3032202 RepID=UPI00249FC931|nr:UDP-N-acetylmuramate dehydrogenase [Actinoplanes sp. NBRC 103695]GLY96903.1 UDP-N-acetylenolpyruvoylglucosamine reductase [Actinoplanes sp. NBRC 103695]
MSEVSPVQRVEAPPGSLGAYTTLRLGGPAGLLTVATEPDEAVQAVRNASVAGEPVLILAGGSNLVVGDAGFPGHVVLLRTRGISEIGRDDDSVTLRVAAGEVWDDFVARTVAEGLSGVECLAGIPGSAGATPIQNVGAYGQEVAHTIVAVHAYDRVAGELVTMTAAECGFGYRGSIFKYSDRWLVLQVDFRLARSRDSAPVRYAELARRLGVEPGDRVPLEQARDTVLKLRAGKGMVLDPDDRDTWSVGSFFTNPVVAELPEPDMPHWPTEDGRVKIPAAWLIEHSGFAKGFSTGGGVAISSKHTLALTNRGTGTTTALLELARVIRDGVRDRFGVDLHPEPVLIGCEFG